jgi:hypothetical protein
LILFLQNGFRHGYIACYWSHPEYYSYLGIETSKIADVMQSGYFKLSFRSDSEFNSLESIKKMYLESKQKARNIALRISLNNYGATKRQLADLVHDYIVNNVTYFEREADFRYLTYGALVFGDAVCQGYAGAFNMICSELGIDSVAVVNEDHMWNVIKLDGKYYYYDCTWDEPDDGKAPKTTYRGVSEKVIRATHGDFTFYQFAMPQNNKQNIAFA